MAKKEKVLRNGLKINGSLAAGTGDPILTKDTTSKNIGEVPAIDTSTFLSTTLLSGRVFVGNVSNIATAVQISGMASITNTGLLSITPLTITNSHVSATAAIVYSKLNLTGGIVNTDVSATAGIARTKIASGNSYRILINNGSGVLTDATAITANSLLISDVNGIPVASGVTSTEAGYISGVTSPIQTQLSNKLSFSSAISPVEGDLVYYDGANWVNFPRGTSGQYLTSNATTLEWVTTPNGLPTGGTANQYLTKIDGTDFNTQWSDLTLSQVTDVTASAAQVNVLATGFYDATSSVQTQLNQKLSTSLTYNSLLVGNIGNVASTLPAGSNGQVLTISGGSPSWQTVVGTGSVTSVDVSGGTTGLTTTGGPVTTTGTITLTGTVNVAHGGTGLATTTPYAILAGGTTGTGALQQVSGLGTSGYVLTSNGAGALPTWQVASGGAGTFVGLTDGPGSFAGNALLGVRVNAGETALEYVALGGSGTVTSVSVVTANGVSGSVATATTTPAITLTLGAITPTSVNSVVLSGASTPTLAVTGTTTVSGTNTGDQTITLTGEATGTGTGSFAVTLTNSAVIGKVLTGYTSGAGTVAATDTILQAIQKLNGNDVLKWSLASGGTLTGANTITSNAANQLTWNGTWTASANSQYHSIFNPTITSRATASDSISAYYINPTINVNSTSIDAVGLSVRATLVVSGAIATFAETGRSTVGMTPGTYTSVAPASTTGSGTGALFTVVVATATTFTSVTVTSGGSGYATGDSITFNATQFGGSSGTLTEQVITITGKSLAATSSVFRVGAGSLQTSGTYQKYIDFVNSSGTTFGSIGSAFSGGINSFAIYDRIGQMIHSDGTTLTFSRALSITQSVSLPTTTITGVVTNTLAPTSTNPLVFKTTGTVYPTTTNTKFSGYNAANSVTTGIISTLGAITGGSGYTNGSYSNAPFTGGTGTGAFAANITVAGGAVTSVTIQPGFGSGYTVGDSLSISAANIGGTGTGFSILVSAVDFSGTIVSGYGYTSTLTDASSPNKYVAFYAAPTINQTASATGLTAALYYDPTITNSVSGNYGVVIVPTTTKSGFGTSTPLSNVDVVGSVGCAIITVTTTTPLDATHHTVLVDATSGAVTINLPTSTSSNRRVYTIKKIDASVNVVTIDGDASETIDGVTTQTLTLQYQKKSIQSNGSAWYIIGE